MSVKAAIFDVFGTCVDWRTGVAAVLRPELAARGIAIAPEALADAWRAEYQPAMERIRAGNRGYVPLDLLHRENLDRALVALGIGEAFDTAERDRLAHAWECLPPWPDTVPGLAAMRAAGLFLAPCSNGSIALMVRLARFAGLPWDAVLGAEIARSYKPRPEVYLASVSALGLRPAEVVMVAAHNDDLAAAQALGLATAFVARPTEYGPGQVADLAPTGDWTWVAADFRDLAGRIAG